MLVWLAGWSDNRVADLGVDELVDGLTIAMESWLAGLLVGWTTGWPVCWLADWWGRRFLVSCLVAWPVVGLHSGLPTWLDPDSLVCPVGRQS